MNISACNKQWLTQSPDRKQAESLAQQCNLPIAIAAILLQRGLSEPEKIHRFLRPSLDQLADPFLMKGMREGVDILTAALTNKLPVIIYGDYDVDGTTGTAVLARFFKHFDTTTFCCQPDRLADGYGLHGHLIEKIHREAISSDTAAGGVLITVDCGISDREQVAYAKRLGLQVIVTDHHQPPADLPSADTVINPWQPGCTFPFKELAGVGVAFYLAMGLRSHLVKCGFWDAQSAPVLKKMLDLVAIGTIADLVPLTDINRILVKAGIEVLQSTENTGLNALLHACGLRGKKITAEDIAFQVAPRLNAPGRMLGVSNMSLDLLLTDSAEQAAGLAKTIDCINQDRRAQGEKLFESGREMAQQQVDTGRKSIVVAGDEWHLGLIGIAATKLAKHFGRPAIVISKKDTTCRGSGRSITGCNLYDIINECRHLLASYGGHENAVGLSMPPENLPIFIEQFEAVIAEHLKEAGEIQAVKIDWHLESTDRLDENLMQWFNLLGPFGQGNREPIFSISLNKIHDNRIVGGNHLRFTIKQTPIDAVNGIGFQFGKLLTLITKNKNSENLLAFTLKHNTFKGKGEWQAQAADFLFFMS